MMGDIEILKDIRAIWTQRRYTSSRTPTQAGDLMAQQLTELIEARATPIEDPEWEYGFPKGLMNDATFSTPKRAMASVGVFLRGGPLMRRTKAGPWESIP